MRTRALVFALPAALWLIACAPSRPDGEDGSDSDGSDSDGTDGTDGDGNNPGWIDAAPFEPPPDPPMTGTCDKIDILFVIDNSGSMGDEQTNLASNFPMFAQLIDTYTTSAGNTLDYHVGVTTTDNDYTTIIDFLGTPIPTMSDGTDGILHTKGRDANFNEVNCNFPAGRRYLQRGDANFADVFSCVAKQGVEGDANEMPLEAMKRALTKRVQDGNNAGFLREDALLAIVFLTDEEDCSRVEDTIMMGPFQPDMCDAASPVDPYLTIVDGVKGGERGRWATAVIAGVDAPNGCSSMSGGAEYASRLMQFSQAPMVNSVAASICADSLAPALQQAFETFSAACESFPPVE